MNAKHDAVEQYFHRTPLYFERQGLKKRGQGFRRGSSYLTVYLYGGDASQDPGEYGKGPLFMYCNHDINVCFPDWSETLL